MAIPARLTLEGISRAVHDHAARDGFNLDEAQQAALPVVAGLLAWPRRLLSPRPPRTGVYLWGGVGRGKTWLVDAAVAAMPAGVVLRLHLHEFFRRLHPALGRHAGVGNRMAAALDDVLLGRPVLVVDEFHLHDVGNAMLMAPVLRELLRRRVMLLATSNYAPDQLLADPLYHHLFEPAIGLLHEHLHVVEMDGGRDHRMQRRGGTSAPAEGFSSGAWLERGAAHYLAVQGLEPPTASSLAVPLGSRSVWAHAAFGDKVWFDFGDLCDVPVAAADYIQLATRFKTWVLRGLPPLALASQAARERFVLLIDVLHDQDRRLVLADAPSPDDLFAGTQMLTDASRAASRLTQLRRGASTSTV